MTADRTVETLAGRLRAFVAEHGAPAVAVLEHLGRVGFRVVVVAADGRFTDAVVADEPTGRALAEAAGLAVGSWDRELCARVAIGPDERRRMAGTGR